ncbi:MAG: hypothetical protein RQ756_03980 [Flavobacteriaceae bacterium]|nr:hypothetical protein [Flavobacteriaceae bacterium]
MQENKERISAFLNSEFFIKPEVLKEYIDTSMQFHWNASTGYSKLSLNQLTELCKHMQQSFTDCTVKVFQCIAEHDLVSAHFVLHMQPVETSENNDLQEIARFMAIFKLNQQQKITEAWIFSHQAYEDYLPQVDSYLKISSLN